MAKIDIHALKKRIIDDNLVGEIFDALEIKKVHSEQGGRLWVGGLPDRFNSQNTRAVQTRNKGGLTSYIRNRNDFEGDIFDLVSYIQFDARGEDIKKNFFKSVNFVCDILGIKNGSLETYKKTIDYASPLKKLLMKAKQIDKVRPNPPIPEYYLDDYDNLFPASWYDEGIAIETMVHFDIKMDSFTNRIVIPIRNKRGQLVGTKGRLCYDEDINDYNPKYKYLDILNASQELFNFHEAKDEIKKKNKVYLFEGEKSVMKLWQNGIKNAVAFFSSNLSKAQYDLINSCGDSVDFIFCYDNDKKPSDIQAEIEKINAFSGENKHDFYAIVDTDQLLPPKSSPIDGGIEIFNNLEKNYCFNIG